MVACRHHDYVILELLLGDREYQHLMNLFDLGFVSQHRELGRGELRCLCHGHFSLQHCVRRHD
jgi:hypothetical protein